MAPRKRKTEQEDHSKPETLLKRVTRSSTRFGNATSVPSTTDSNHLDLPAREKKLKGKAKGKTQPKSESEKEKAEESAKEMPGKMPASQIQEAKRKATLAEAVILKKGTLADGSQKKTIVIEHCKQCNSFRQRAVQVKDGLEKGVSGITVLLNPKKPRRGCFEIREEGGQTFVSLLNMERPFKPMKNLDMQKVISDIIDKIND